VRHGRDRADGVNGMIDLDGEATGMTDLEGEATGMTEWMGEANEMTEWMGEANETTGRAGELMRRGVRSDERGGSDGTMVQNIVAMR
jgi:hypothetical protein